MSVAAIIVAGGRGLRLGGDVPKQLRDLGGRSLLQRSVSAFDAHPRVSAIVVVLPGELVDQGARLAGETRRPCRFVAGGPRRQDSVREGLAAVGAEAATVLVHDAARPFVTAALIDRVIDATAWHGAVIPATGVRDTVKRADAHGVVRETIARDGLWLVQTPQGFARAVLEGAVAAHGDADATDEAMIVERAGHPVHVVPGDPDNVKITDARDLDEARARLAGIPRVGTGYDLHRLMDGRPLVLAGVAVAADRGPQAHSDGDVVCHAIVDAMLGAAAAGDIGQHFPDTDPTWKNAAGLDLLGRAVAVVTSRGLRPVNVDVTVVLERPKLAPHVVAIREAIARVLRLDVGAVGVKAKTNEGVDAVGRGEAIAAHAVAMLTGGATHD